MLTIARLGHESPSTHPSLVASVPTAQQDSTIFAPRCATWAARPQFRQGMGLFCEYLALPAGNCYPLPDTMSFEVAALMEPLSVSLHAVKRAGPFQGAAVLIMGAGPIGQLNPIGSLGLWGRQGGLERADRLAQGKCPAERRAFGPGPRRRQGP